MPSRAKGSEIRPWHPRRIASGQPELDVWATFRLALCLGILVGFGEAGSHIALRRISGNITYETLRTNWHYGWMIPLSYVCLFGVAGLLLSAAVAFRPGKVMARASACLLAFLAALPGVMVIPRLHWLATGAISLALALRLGPWMVVRRRALDRMVTRSLFPLMLLLVVVGIWQWWVVSGAERRALASLPKADTDVPNVLLIVLDTARFDGVFPSPPARVPAPFLGRLGRRGVRFDEARSTAPWTLPSHASLFTGRWPHELSATVRRPLDDSHPTLAEHMARKGYATAAFMGNTHNGNAWYGLSRGFSRYEDYYENTAVNGLELLRSSRIGSALLVSQPGQRLFRTILAEPPYRYRKSAAMISRDALGWIDRNRERPFFAVLNYYDVHDPYEPPPGEPRPYSSAPGPAADRPVECRTRDMYDDCLAYLDAQLERFFGELERRGLLKNTAVVVTADHGEHFGEHQLQGHGISLYRPELHVPLLILLPAGRGAGVTVSDPVSLRDVPATIAELAGASDDSPFPGRSLSRYWAAGSSSEPDVPVLAEVEPGVGLQETLPHAPTRRGAVRAVVTRGHIFIRNGDGEEELYDLDDELETDNRIDEPDHDPPLEHFRETLDRLLRETEDGR